MHGLASPCAIDAFSATASAVYILQVFNASQLVCPRVFGQYVAAADEILQHVSAVEIGCHDGPEAFECGIPTMHSAAAVKLAWHVGVGEASSAEEADQQSSERSVATLLTGTGPSWELHGPRVARRLRHRTRCHHLADIHHC